MSILKIARMGHPVLRQISRPVAVEEIKTDAFQYFCQDMLETMEEYEGAGLAAPQVHMPIRVAVLTLTDEPEFFINPVITPLTDKLKTTTEGCLSVPNMRGLVARPSKVRIEALDRHGNPKAYELEGFPAVVVQHECDHLDGILYVDKVIETSLMFLDEYERYGMPPGLRDNDDDDDWSDELDHVVQDEANEEQS